MIRNFGPQLYRHVHSRRAPAKRSFASLSPRQEANLEETVENALSSLQVPNLPLSLGALGILQNVRCTNGKVVINTQFPSLASDSLHAIRQFIHAGAQSALSKVQVSLPVDVAVQPWRRPNPRMSKAGKCLESVGSVVAVASGKGGVGKSSVAVNLAFALAKRGARVGLLDCDVYGPSLPTMVRPASMEVKQDKAGNINALTGPLGVKCMSYGWVARRNEKGERGGAFMRGPMVSQVIQQLAKFTEWGAVDHLILDMPPGTGDIHISLGQLLPLNGAVHVTTPQGLALADVAKGVDMFAALKVRPLGLVLNMAYFTPEDAPDKKYRPFGGSPAAMEALYTRSGMSPAQTFELPILPSLSESGDSGIPEVVRCPDSEASRVYDKLAGYVATQVQNDVFEELAAAVQAAGSTTVAAGTSTPESAASVALADAPAQHNLTASASSGGTRVTVSYTAARGGIVLRTVSESGATESVLSPAVVRRACRCAACVDELTGRQRLKPETVREDIRPKSVAVQGNYGVAITWSDGHASSIYTFDQLQGLGKQ